MTDADETLSAIRRADPELLGFRPDDAAELRALIASLPDDPARLTRVTDLATKLRANIGNLFDTEPPVADYRGLTTFDDGLVTLLALLAIADDSHAEYRRRGVPDDVAWRSLSDLGQQVHIFRQVFGFFGLGAQSWCSANFTGRHLWLGRLQFTLQRDDDTDDNVLGVHIPEDGPLTPELVDASLAMAREIALPAYRDHAPTAITLHSWLLDPALLALLPEHANVVRFARRFEPYGEPTMSVRAGLFFGFHLEPRLQPIDLSALPTSSSLHRALVARIADGGPAEVAGRLKHWPDR